MKAEETKDTEEIVYVDIPEDTRWRAAITGLRERYAGTSYSRDVNALLDELIVLKIFRDRGM